mgnify:CR=1 FL=1
MHDIRISSTMCYINESYNNDNHSPFCLLFLFFIFIFIFIFIFYSYFFIFLKQGKSGKALPNHIILDILKRTRPNRVPE